MESGKSAMRIAVIGGGPGGLYFAALAARADPSRHVTVYERNAPDDTFGFGVVFSDETLEAIEVGDAEIFAELARRFVRWDDIDVHYRPTVDGPSSPVTSGGHRFAAVSRVALLSLLHKRCADLGVDLRFQTEAPPAAELMASHDLVVAADGVHSATRTDFAAHFEPDLDTRDCRYIWLGSDKPFESFTFDVRRTPHGVMQMHAYPYDSGGSTVIFEMRSDVWAAAGLTDGNAIERCGELFADRLHGHTLHGNGSKWINFTTVRCGRWSRGNLVLLGDAAHTAHFSIGSGTKLAMQDAASLAAHLSSDVPTALAAFEAERRPVVLSTQRAAQASLEWFEDLDSYLGQEPEQFAFNLLTRSRRITYDNLRLRDAGYVSHVDDWFARHVGAAEVRPPMFQPVTVGGLALRNRVVVSAMDMYSATDGLPGDFHLVHLGSKALGGAGLVMTEMVCVSESGRITPGCTGLYTDAQRDSWKRVADFVHAHTDARIGVQLGHSGRKGSTKLMWEGIDDPLPEGNWDLLAPSPLPYKAASQPPREATVEELQAIREEFGASARRAREAGFDLLELHCAHGYLLSSFISPLTNHRTDHYGGSLEARLRFPLEVFAAVREEWPGPMSVRLSATDWHPDGLTPEESIAVARAFATAGADAIDVSTGQVVSEERPAYGRSYQTPYADRIRHSLRRDFPDLRVIAVGAISSYDDVNSILMAGRADLCALGRTHLWDPQWTLHAAVDQGHPMPWPPQFAAGARKPPTGRG
ncbi:bifunctional salicylyl-CoA 5-hydroxylase/oxidoreductase [Actinorhabdospora filicis]|uniref:bifunctional salicylyl-CoA 5-hydroxylase/oxidoreductase n=1 Tax=Actinorhabdospora filicis TaxID=1785913 RepID=UPI002553213D|nr:bifunctional salicylyl-CoA 5-hydroxylase/oxidoreductase [Actinorhabdospora filicis]